MLESTNLHATVPEPHGRIGTLRTQVSNTAVKENARNTSRLIDARDAAVLLAAQVMNMEHTSASAAAKSYLGPSASSAEVNNFRGKVTFQVRKFKNNDDDDLWKSLISENTESRDSLTSRESDDSFDDHEHRAQQYQSAFYHALELYHHRGYSCRKAAAEARSIFGCGPGHSTISTSGDNHVNPNTGEFIGPLPHGPPNMYPQCGYETIRDWVLLMRSRRLLVDRDLICTQMYNILPPEAQAWFGGDDGPGRVTRFYYEHLFHLFPHDLGKPAATHAHEMRRAMWTKSEYLGTHYDLIAAEAVRIKIAVYNPLFDAEDSTSELIFWTHPERVFSFDETNVPLGTCKDNSAGSRGIKSVRAGPSSGVSDKGEVLANKTSYRATGVGGSLGSFDPIPARFILQNQSDSINPDHCAGGPLACVRGVLHEPTFGCNNTGAAKNNESLRFVQQNIMPLLDPPPSADLGALIICDCYADHYTAEMVNYCVESSLSLQLRVPNTSSDIQNEDLINFGTFKPLYNAAKSRAYRDQLLSTHGKTTSLAPEKLVSLAKVPWETAFDRTHNAKAWAAAGLQPFNRQPYWTVKKEEDAALVQLARVNRITVEEAQLNRSSLLWDNSNTHSSTVTAAPSIPVFPTAVDDSDSSNDETGEDGEDENEEENEEENVAVPAVAPAVKLKKVKPGEISLSGPVTHSAMVARINAFANQQVAEAAAAAERRVAAAAKKVATSTEKARKASLGQELKELQASTPGLVAQVKHLSKAKKLAQKQAQDTTEIESDLAEVQAMLDTKKERIEEIKLAKKTPPPAAPGSAVVHPTV